MSACALIKVTMQFLPENLLPMARPDQGVKPTSCACGRSSLAHTQPEVCALHSRANSAYSGFTIIEVLIVLAISALLLLVIFGVVPEAQRNQRNQSRKHTMELVYGTMVEYYNTHGSYPSTQAEFDAYKAENPELDKYHKVEFRDADASHNFYPEMDTIALQTGHWCNRYGNGDNTTDPIAGNHSFVKLFSVWTLLEPDNYGTHRNFSCTDNYDNS